MLRNLRPSAALRHGSLVALARGSVDRHPLPLGLERLHPLGVVAEDQDGARHGADLVPPSGAGDLAHGGALGQPQFLPSYYLKYAIDFDADGGRDIWRSVPDTLASIANFLRAEGWNPSRGWGVEAKVPPSVACSLEGPEQGKGMAEWARLGVTRVDGRPLPGIDLDRESFLLMPAGRLGPAFIVSGNFYVLKAYNFSDLYVLYVGHLSDRISDSRPFEKSWSKDKQLRTTDVETMQRTLAKLGLYKDKIDGKAGMLTRAALGAYQKANGLKLDCWPTAAVLEHMDR